jgi:hypothetical protein
MLMGIVKAPEKCARWARFRDADYVGKLARIAPHCSALDAKC